MLNQPSVSVIVPLYNKAAYVLTTLESVLNQTRKDWELVVVDNMSADHGLDVVRSVADPRVRTVECVRRGVSAARNTGLQEAKGTWLVFLDADDLFEPSYLESQLRTAQAENANLIMCRYAEFADGSDPKVELRIPVHEQASYERVIGSSIVFCPGPQHIFIVKRNLVTQALRWPEHLDTLLGEDATFWFRLLNESRFAFNPEVLARYRVRTPESRYTRLSDAEVMLKGLHAAIQENLAYLRANQRDPTVDQIETLFRFYANVYSDARRRRLKATTAEALHHARAWQRLYLQTASQPKLSMLVRHWLGLSLFSKCFRHG
jgi:glycosyltransferase involved in cell wall biosynthesis